MPIQTYISYYPSVAAPGQLWNSDLYDKDRYTGISTVDLEPGVIVQADAGGVDYTRYAVSAASATLTVDNYMALNLMYLNENSYAPTPLGQTISNEDYIYKAGQQLSLLENGGLYLICEKVISDPSASVYVRVANPTAPLEGIGYVTDTADGTDTLELTNAKFLGTDATTYLQTKDAGITAEFERGRMGMLAGYSVVPVMIR